jgi:ABC-type antimicrobial peptide transport system permease subunit
VIGVAETVRYQSIETQDVRSMVYLRHQSLPAMTLVVKTESNPSQLGTAIRSILEDLDPELAPGAMVTQQDLLDSVTNGDRFNLVVFAIFGIIALLLAAVGMYAVIGYAVTQRTPELGVRLALGARAGDLLRMVLAEGLVLGMIGIALGLVSARAATGVMTSLLFQTAPTDTVAFLSVSALLLGMTLLASGIPALRAMRVDPATALRQEA